MPFPRTRITIAVLSSARRGRFRGSLSLSQNASRIQTLHPPVAPPYFDLSPPPHPDSQSSPTRRNLTFPIPPLPFHRLPHRPYKPRRPRKRARAIEAPKAHGINPTPPGCSARPKARASARRPGAAAATSNPAHQPACAGRDPARAAAARARPHRAQAGPAPQAQPQPA